MLKYTLRALLFWLPALFASFLPDSAFALVFQWFFAFFLLLGWPVNTAMAAYRFARAALSRLLGWAGLSALTLVVMYSNDYTSPLRALARLLSGLLCVWPLEVVVRTLQAVWNGPCELAIFALLFTGCAVGWLVGALTGRIVRLRGTKIRY